MAIFNIYRYQLLPTERQHQGMLFDYKTVEDVIKNKNKIFRNEISKKRFLQTRRLKTIIASIFEKDDIFVFRVGVNRDLRRETMDFKQETLDTWPHVLVAIWNHPDKQLIAVQKNSAAFSDTQTLINILSRNLNRHFNAYKLGIFINPIFETRHFWDIVERNEGKIQAINFKFITPNMSNISGAIADALKEVSRNTNSVENELGLKAAPKSSLTLSQEDPHVSSLLDYSSKGGGSASIKLKNIRQKIKTGENIKEIEIDEIDITSDDPKGIVRLIEQLFK